MRFVGASSVVDTVCQSLMTLEEIYRNRAVMMVINIKDITLWRYGVLEDSAAAVVVVLNMKELVAKGCG